MDLEKVKQLRCLLTLHFAIIAWLTAMLVATGSGSIFLPVFIFFVSASAYLFVDKLQWFELGRVGSYVGMTAATSIAIASYIYNAFYVPSESGQLLAVAGLLVYPEAVLFLQRKNLRIYEQLAVFLLLEMIVAALVNDNVVFGILLTPIILLWVSSLLLFSRYATLVHIDPSIETPQPKLAEVLFKRFMKHVLGDSPVRKPVTTHLVTGRDVQRSLTFRRMVQSFPIGVGALAFAGMFFYFLPRTTPSTLQTGMGNESRVGLPSVLRFGEVGKILQNRSPVMRVSLTHALSGKPYQLNPDSAPYLRSIVFDSYGPSSRGRWVARGEWQALATPRHRKLSSGGLVRGLTNFNRDLVHVEFDIRRRFASSMYTLPPSYATNKVQNIKLNHDPVRMLLQKLDESNMLQSRSLVYELGSAAFAGGTQSPVTPAHLSFSSPNQLDQEHAYELTVLTRGFNAFDNANDYRRQLLSRAGIQDAKSDRFAAALAIEDHFLNSGEFTYSLDLSPPSDPDLDPIEDFIVHQRSGHCQYFASAMAAMMRQSGIPTRLVVGYRPTEYNRLGDYFLVRQSDAHAWLEGFFKREELVGTPYQQFLTNADAYWVRFDPTPATNGEDGEITEQQGQAIDFAEKLWKDYVVEGQKLNGENSLYAPVAENSKDAYDELVLAFNRIRESIQQGRFWNGQQFGFLGVMVIAIVGILIFGVAIWQGIAFFPKFAPKWALRLGVVKERSNISQQFYARCIRLLEQLGVRRHPSETPQEFSHNANRILMEQGQDADQSLTFLTKLYYQLRFGSKKQPTQDDLRAIDQELTTVENAVASSRR